jgi:SPP1 gp7 family putative phage head morphogenesis protein
MEDLISRVERVWGGPRADVAAITEVTRLYAEGNRAAWAASGVVKALQWKTSQDERVCPVCGPLADTELAMDAEDVPPAHPRCRCWIVPVVKKASEM